MILTLIDGQMQRFGKIDGIVEDGRRAEGERRARFLVWHCAGARMHLGDGGGRKLAYRDMWAVHVLSFPVKTDISKSELGSPAHKFGRPAERCSRAIMADQASRLRGIKMWGCKILGRRH